jgi:hypothetical protein
LFLLLAIGWVFASFFQGAAGLYLLIDVRSDWPSA